MSRSWKKIYGIDPDVPIGREDIDAVQESLGFDDERGRLRAHLPWWAPILSIVPIAVLFIIGLVMIGSLKWPWWTMVPLLAAAICWMSSAGGWVVRRYIGPLIRRELRSRGFDICVRCGYWLRGLGEDARNCPECGTAREATPR